MVSDLSFSTYYEVVQSWNRIKNVQDYDKTFAIIVFSYFFSAHPDATSLLGIEGGSGDWMKNDLFLPEAKKFVSRFDSFVDMLGPDADIFSEILEEEGRNHANIGVKLEHYASMGEALLEGVRTHDNKCNNVTELCWKKVYSDLTRDMGKIVVNDKTMRRHTL